MLSRSLLQQAWIGLPALAVFRNIVRTKVNIGDFHAMAGEGCFHPGVDIFNIFEARLSQRYAALIGDHNDLESRPLQVQSR
jgi:hypothetical protein